MNEMNNEMNKEQFLKANSSKELHDTVGQYNIVDFINEFGTNGEITCLMTDIILYQAPETKWSVKTNRYVETGEMVEKASVIVKLPVNHEWGENEYLVYCPLSRVPVLRTIKNNNWIENTTITFSVFTNENGKEIGYIKEMC